MVTLQVHTCCLFLSRLLAVLAVLLLHHSAVLGQTSTLVDITITGLEESEPLQQNVLRHLSIVKHKTDPGLKEPEVRRLFQKADNEILTALEPFGFYSSVVEKELLLEEQVWKATFHIKLNKAVRIRQLDIKLTGEGQREYDLKAAVAAFPLKIGDILDHQFYEEGKRNLTATSLKLGYRDVSFISHVVEINRSTSRADVLLKLDTGPRYLFGKTTFEADFISHDLLSRMLPYEENDPFSPTVLVELRQSLLNSDYFSNVEIVTSSQAEESLIIPIKISLKPRIKNKYGVGIGYGTDTGLRGSLEWTSRLLNRYGHQFTLQIQPSERKSYFGGVYTIPVRNPRKDRLSLLGKWETEQFDTTDTESRTVSVSYDHIKPSGEYSLYLAYLDEDYDTGVESGHATLLMPGLKTTWRFADDRLRTRKGVRVSVNLTGANEDFFSDTSFLQASLSSKAIFTFREKWRFIGRFQAGATMFDDLYELPPSLRYYAGGDQSVRGYAYKSIGPTDPLGNVLGGRYLLTYSVELERALTKSWSGALFLDGGDAFNAVPDMEMKFGAGVGIRWNAPFGQVRLDLANALSDDGNSWRIHFNVGADL